MMLNPPRRNFALRALSREEDRHPTFSIESCSKNFLPRWNQDGEIRVVHGVLEGIMLCIVGNTINPRGLSNTSLPQNEDVEVIFGYRCLWIQ